jgi:hypothetical protein
VVEPLVREILNTVSLCAFLYLTNALIYRNLFVFILEVSMVLIIAFTGVTGLITSIVMTVVVYRKQAEKDRLAFLSNVIFDTTIPRESRQPFYDEYIAKHGNGTVVKSWLLEGQREKLSNS